MRIINDQNFYLFIEIIEESLQLRFNLDESEEVLTYKEKVNIYLNSLNEILDWAMEEIDNQEEFLWWYLGKLKIEIKKREEVLDETEDYEKIDSLQRQKKNIFFLLRRINCNRTEIQIKTEEQ